MKTKTNSWTAWLCRHERLTVSAIIALYVAVTTVGIGWWSIWFDEGYSYAIARFSFDQIFAITALDVHPPMYYWLLHGWMEVFGYGELAGRSLSVVAGAVGLVGLYCLLKRLFSSSSLVLSALFFAALTPQLVRYGEEMRMYTIVTAIVIWATYALVRATYDRQRTSRWWIVYGVLVSLGMWTHYFTAVVWLAHWTWRLIERRAGRIKRFWTPQWIMTHVVAVGLFLPWLPAVIQQFRTVQEGFWIPAISPATLTNYVANTFLYLQDQLVMGYMALVVIAIIVVLVILLVQLRKQPIRDQRQRSAIVLISCMALVPPLYLMLLSLPPLRSSFVDRYVLASMVFLVVLVVVSATLTTWGTRYRRWILTGLLVMQLVGIGSVYLAHGRYDNSGSRDIDTRTLITMIGHDDTGSTPIIILDKWNYYEALPYTSSSHPILLLEDGLYQWGSYEPIRRQTDRQNIISSTDMMTLTGPIWIVQQTDQQPIEQRLPDWRVLRTLDVTDRWRGQVYYRAYLVEKVQ